MNGADSLTSFVPENAVLLSPAITGGGYSVSLDDFLCRFSTGVRSWVLHCGFEERGPWGGVRDLFKTIIADLLAKAPTLAEKHDYELVHVLPELKSKLNLRNPSLTDIASTAERVRNYPADRALRIVHGLIDLLEEYKLKTVEPEESWVLVCLNFDRTSHIGEHFFKELMRRRGARLRLTLVAVGPTLEWAQERFVNPVSELPFALVAPGSAGPIDPHEANRLASTLELEMGDDVLVNTAYLPEIIRLWRIARRQDKVLDCTFEALHAFNTLGLYQDALRYGEMTRELLKTTPVDSPVNAHWGTFFKLFMSYLGIGEIDTALRLAEEQLRNDRDDPVEYPMRIRLCYLVAMLYARYFPQRDFATGELFLEKGLGYIQKAQIPEDERWFQLVFNRNGLAMVRSFQGRFEEALELCRSGYALLEQHLSPDRHRLHRSVLIYNIAQVYTHVGAYEQAIEHYSAAMTMDPNYSEYYNERGNLLLKLGRLQEAERDYRQAIMLSPPYFEVWTNLGQCYRLWGRMKKAVESFSQALDLAPKETTALIGRAQVLQEVGDLDGAIKDYGAALNVDSSLWKAYAGRAVLLYEKGLLHEALADLNAAVVLAPGEAELYQNRAVALADLHRDAEASRDLEEYLRLSPEASDRGEVESRLQALAGSLSSCQKIELTGAQEQARPTL